MWNRRFCPSFRIENKVVGAAGSPCYFIADVAANHDGQLERAVQLIRLAASAGADAVKFQNFRAPQIVSQKGFEALGQLSHQKAWTKSVVEVYQDASLPWTWTSTLKEECDACGVAYLTTPYDLEAVDHVDPFVGAFKIGSGDITWPAMLRKVAGKGKPVILSTGASTMREVDRAREIIQEINPHLALLQCNTNYTNDAGNVPHVNLRVISCYRSLCPPVVVGLSDHTKSLAVVLGAVALGAKIVERHFTDDPGREGPDHAFSMTPDQWREMVQATRELESAMGDGVKRVQDNERDAVVVQRRAIRAARDLEAGTVLQEMDLAMLRPCPPSALPPGQAPGIVGHALVVDVAKGEALR